MQSHVLKITYANLIPAYFPGYWRREWSRPNDRVIFKMFTLKITAILAICAGILIALASSEFGPELALAVVSLV
ncbi:hypothetical protein JQ600_04865 [Bradyrhizobium sp. AUGA SZCCT0176]|uniref:hypothetical protein n=1 Tax=Bradyrhizobium sp. AUGA SZCCT0176 TaxID=2807664 RepID=UPI001BA824A4|nr:hypothetical protein [Bradyrhizobium sp. AUGA SZCCT0176]MBR1224235.1 hypothetical protein [Bradyrhizobium sp. AUGA SZCCT0176]